MHARQTIDVLEKTPESISLDDLEALIKSLEGEQKNPESRRATKFHYYTR